jgi:diphosphomevalonate decarboxylase
MTRSSDISATVEWESPSNLAIVKYWGKQGIQEPLNPSISFSLKKAVTHTKVTAQPADEFGFSFYWMA